MAQPKTQYWMLKTEPETYSFAQLQKDGKTNWNNIRNFQARNHLKSFQPGDIALIYHSGDTKSVVGLARIASTAYPDPDPLKKGDWLQVDIMPTRQLAQPVTLKTLKATAQLKDLVLIRQSRLSVSPVTPAQFEAILALAEGKGVAK